MDYWPHAEFTFPYHCGLVRVELIFVVLVTIVIKLLFSFQKLWMEI